MDYLNNLLANPESAETVLLWSITGAAFFVILGALVLLNQHFDPVRMRFLRDTNRSEINQVFSEGANPFSKYQQILLPNDTEVVNRTTQRLHHAGYHYRKHLHQYFAIRLLLIVTLPLVTFVILTLIPQAGTDAYFQGCLFAAVTGFVLPSFVLDKKIANRQKMIQRAFPDALDLLLVCCEAGLSLDAAFQRVAGEISFSQPILAQELNLLIAEVRAGVERKKAFNNLAERTGVQDIRGLMSAINQSMRFGASISQTLRIYSAEFRDKRMQAAEEKAAKIGAKLIFPTVLCLLPCFLLIVLVPFALNLLNAFKNF